MGGKSHALLTEELEAYLRCLRCLRCLSCGVFSLGEVLRDVRPEELASAQPLHSSTISGQ